MLDENIEPINIDKYIQIVLAPVAPAPEAIPPPYTPTSWETNPAPVYTQPAAPTSTATTAQPASKSID